ncbi:MAG: metallophosphoesterase [Firmicutes bacterium]|nr:metallophosphoesterase [Bacillota bacterium]
MLTRIRKLSKTALCIISFLLVILGTLFAVVSWQGLNVSYYEIDSDKMDGAIRIAHLSDLHSTWFGDGQEDLLNAIAQEDPDIVCFTGDICDDKIPHGGTVKLIETLGRTYDCYYVTGNHETYVPEGLDTIKEEIFEENGITVLDPGSETLEIDGSRITVCGIDDIEISKYDEWMRQMKECSDNKDDDIFSVLLSHRPERVEEYEDCDFDLILSGHAHGGQIRIPGICNGIYASNQGFFPDYVGGEYKLENESTMIVSRGLVKNILPRTFNPPELVIIDIT